jgi:hypothetical protein
MRNRTGVRTLPDVLERFTMSDKVRYGDKTKGRTSRQFGVWGLKDEENVLTGVKAYPTITTRLAV